MLTPFFTLTSSPKYRVGQNHIYTVYIRYFWQGNYNCTVIYGVYIRFWPTLPKYLLCARHFLAKFVAMCTPFAHLLHDPNTFCVHPTSWLFVAEFNLKRIHVLTQVRTQVRLFAQATAMRTHFRAIVFVCRSSFSPRQLHAHSYLRDCFRMQMQLFARQLQCALTFARTFLYAGASLCVGDCDAHLLSHNCFRMQVPRQLRCALMFV